MSDNRIESAIGLVSANSLHYVSHAISNLNQGRKVLNLRSESDFERINAFNIKEIISVPPSYGWYDGPAFTLQPDSESIAQILFTSGTEGTPKSILISHRALANTTNRLIEVMDIDEEIREYVGVPVNYSFGFGRCRVVSSVGGRFYLPENGFDPAEICSMLIAGEINAVSAVPTLWRIVLSNPELFSQSGEALKWIEIGSQYMSQSEKEQLKEIFPNAKIVQHYGLTEASRTTFLKIHEEQGDVLESVGACIDDNEVRINEDGRIEIKGSHVASKMIKDGEVTSLINDDGWFETSDLGRIDNGYLYYEGRSDDQINCGGIKLSPEHLEQELFDALSIRSGIAVAGIPDAMRGQLPLLAYTKELEPILDQLIDAFKQAVAKFNVDLGLNLKKMCFEEFPKTATGKIQRRKISKIYQEDSYTPIQHSVQSSGGGDSIENKIQGIWQDVLGIPEVPTNVSFFELGGDSLSSISVALRMEKLGVEKSLTKKIFEGYTIGEIARAGAGDADSFEKSVDATANVSQSINLARGLLVIFVVLAHWMPGVVERLPAQISEYNKYLSTLYSFGTPGFAVIFGFGVGFFYLLRYLSSPGSLNSMIRRNAIILFCGMTVLAIVRILKLLLEQGEVTSVDVANAYFSVLYFYFFAVISIPTLLKIVCSSKNITYAALQISAACFAIHILIESLAIPPSENGLIQAGVLLLTTKYNYFEMMSGMAIGMAIGNWIRENLNRIGDYRQISILGILLVALSIVLCWEMGDWELLMVWPKGMTIWSWILYTGLVCIIWFVCFSQIQVQSGRVLAFLKNVLCCVGMLAFPMFIGHELVIPLKDVFVATGVPLALPLSMGLFLTAAYLSIYKMYAIYYK